MSESAAKAKRRDLRRVIGRAALTDFGQLEEAVRTLGTAVNEQRQAVKDIAAHQVELSSDMDDVRYVAKRDYLHFEAVCEPLCNSTLWTRLRWLFTGK